MSATSRTPPSSWPEESRGSWNTGRAVNWVFTFNNYAQEDEERLRLLVEDESSNLAYASWGREVAPTTGTPHLQGQLELVRRMRFHQVRQLIGGGWVAVRRGTFEQAQQYLEKDGDFESHGSRQSVGSGKRTDLMELKNSLDDQLPLQEISSLHFRSFILYSRSIERYRLLHASPRCWQMSVVVYWGTTGSGKTRAVYDNAPSLDSIWCYPGKGWFDGYDSQPIALFDDFSGACFEITYFLKLLDRYPMKVPIKGGFVNWSPQEVYITANFPPSAWYSGARDVSRAALMRRITHVVHFE